MFIKKIILGLTSICLLTTASQASGEIEDFYLNSQNAFEKNYCFRGRIESKKAFVGKTELGYNFDDFTAYIGAEYFLQQRSKENITYLNPGPTLHLRVDQSKFRPYVGATYSITESIFLDGGVVCQIAKKARRADGNNLYLLNPPFNKASLKHAPSVTWEPYLGVYFDWPISVSLYAYYNTSYKELNAEGKAKYTVELDSITKGLGIDLMGKIGIDYLPRSAFQKDFIQNLTLSTSNSYIYTAIGADLSYNIHQYFKVFAGINLNKCFKDSLALTYSELIRDKKYSIGFHAGIDFSF